MKLQRFVVITVALILLLPAMLSVVPVGISSLKSLKADALGTVVQPYNSECTGGGCFDTTTFSFTNPVATGDSIIIVMGAWEDGVSLTMSASDGVNTYSLDIQAGCCSNLQAAILYSSDVTGGALSITVTWASGSPTWHIQTLVAYEVYGSITPDTTGSGNTNAGAPYILTNTPVTFTAADFLVGGYVDDQSETSGSYVVPTPTNSGWTYYSYQASDGSTGGAMYSSTATSPDSFSWTGGTTLGDTSVVGASFIISASPPPPPSNIMSQYATVSCSGATYCSKAFTNDVVKGDMVLVLGGGAQNSNYFYVTDGASDTYHKLVLDTGQTGGSRYAGIWYTYVTSTEALTVTMRNGSTAGYFFDIYDLVNVNSSIANGLYGIETCAPDGCGDTYQMSTNDFTRADINASAFVAGVGVDNLYTSYLPTNGSTCWHLDQSYNTGSYGGGIIRNSTWVTTAKCSDSIDITPSSPFSFNLDSTIVGIYIDPTPPTAIVPLKVTMSNSAPSATITLAGSCHPNSTSFSSNGAVHFFKMYVNCPFALIFTNSGYVRDGFNVSKSFSAVSATLYSCSSGTCSENDSTAYEQLESLYSMTPTTPSVWDAAYSEPVVGTYLGSSKSCTIALAHLGGVAESSCWFDYDLTVYLEGSFASSIAGSWVTSGTYSWTDTTGGNTHNSNYALKDSVTEKITISMSTGSSPNQGDVTISGCDATVSTIPANGVQQTFAADEGCSITYTLSADSTYTRDRFNLLGSAVTTWIYTTAASGTDTKSNTVYHQLENIYKMNPSTPSSWDASYSQSVDGTYLGVSDTSCAISLVSGDGVASATCWFDYYLPVNTPTGFASSVSGTWGATDTNVWTDNTGDNTHTTDYYLVSAITVTFNPLNKSPVSTSLNSSNYFVISYFDSSDNPQVAECYSEPTCTLLIQASTDVVIESPVSSFSTYFQMWTLNSSTPLTYILSSPRTYTLWYYWMFFNPISYTVGSGNPLSGNNPTFTYYTFGTLQSGTLSKTPVSYWMDAGSVIKPQNPWYSNLQSFYPVPTTTIANGDPSFTYAPLSTNCSGHNVDNLFAAGCYAPAIVWTYGNIISIYGFYGALVIIIDILIYRRAHSFLLAFATTTLMAEGLIAATGTLGVQVQLLILFGTGLLGAAYLVRLFRGPRT